MADIVLTGQKDSALGLIEEGTTNTDHDWLPIDLDRVFLVGNRDLNGNATGGQAPVPDQDDGHQQETTNQSIREYGTGFERVEGKTRKEATRNCR